MNLLGPAFPLVVLVVAARLLGAVWWGWSRWPHRLGIAGRACSLLLVMLLGAVLAGTAVNRSLGFYTTLGELLGAAPGGREPPPSFVPAGRGRLVVLTPRWQQRAARAAAAGRGTVLQVLLAGATSGISRPGTVYLPAVYSTGRGDAAMPVVELFHGYPGGPRAFLDQLDLARVLDQEISAQRLPPVIAVVPTTYSGRSSECVDAVRGQRDETYPAVDVPADVDAAFHVRPGRSYAARGYSEGGFCAVNLGLHHPDRYTAAASLSGYFRAGQERGTASL